MLFFVLNIVFTRLAYILFHFYFCRDKFEEGDDDDDLLTSAEPVIDFVMQGERFEKKYVLYSSISDRNTRDVGWDYHMQWARRTCLHPLARAVVSWGMTVMDVYATQPVGQLVIVDANKTDDVLELMRTEPLQISGGISTWSLFEAKVDLDNDNLSMALRQPFLFMALYNTSHPLFSAKNSLDDFDVSHTAQGKHYVPGQSPRALAAAMARISSTTPLSRLEEQQHLHHCLNSVEESSNLDPDRYLEDQKDSDNLEFDEIYYENLAKKTIEEDTRATGHVAMFAVLKDTAPLNMSSLSAALPPSVGTMILLNSASASDARRYLASDPMLASGIYANDQVDVDII